MLTNEEFREVVKYLTSQEVMLRIAALKDLWQFPGASLSHQGGYFKAAHAQVTVTWLQ